MNNNNYTIKHHRLCSVSKNKKFVYEKSRAKFGFAPGKCMGHYSYTIKCKSRGFDNETTVRCALKAI